MNSVSAPLSSSFYPSTPHRLSLSSATTIKLLPLRHSTVACKPNSTTALFCINSYWSSKGSRIVNYGMNRKGPSFKTCVSGQRENWPQQRNNEDGSGVTESEELQNAANSKYPSSLKPLMRVYREAIIYGDAKTVYEVESLILKTENEKNQLMEKVAALSSEISSGKEKYVRLQADFDNYRKRSEKERLTVRSNAQGEVIESLLPMVDSFERAKQQIKIETEKEKKIDTSYQGIYKQFVEIMRSLQVAAVPTVGKPFDPLIHEAIAREESEEFKEGIVIQELRRGFYLGDRLLRPAMVKVSSGPGKNRAPQQPASVAGVDYQ